jgi:hypothetical protein
MIAMVMILLACLAAWAHVLHMLDKASDQLADALNGDLRQAGGWMPSPLLADGRAAASRAFNRA